MVVDESREMMQGFGQSDLLSRSFIDAVVPFVPLQRKHVKQCIEQVLDELQVTDLNTRHEIISSVSKSITYFPKGMEVFSDYGGKQVYQRVHYYLSASNIN